MLQTISGQLSIAIENAKLFEQVIRDELTGLYSRKFLLDRLKEEIKRLQRTGRTLALAMIDIDRFKKVNDEYGHQAGDKVLQQLALILMDEVREIDIVARFGGEEFILLLPETNVADAMGVMERLRLKVEKHAFAIDRDDQTLSLTISIGVSGLCSACSIDASRLINAGDMALFQAKQTGRNRVASAGACQC
jgi:diguanylate cyclase (GGDEF)-like protein